MKKQTFSFVFLILLILPILAFGKDYYIDNNIGNDSFNGETLSTAWETLSKANSTLQPGDTVYIRGGIYANQEIRPVNSGTSENNRIIYTNYNQEIVTICDSAYGIFIYKKYLFTYNTKVGVIFKLELRMV